MVSTPSDEGLVAQARGGDREAFGALVRRHMPAMFALARAYFASDADAEDAVQDAFVKAYGSLDQLQSPARFAAWLATITRRTCLDVLRSTREKLSLADFATTAQLFPRVREQQLTPASLASKGERSDLVKAAVGRLPEKQREALMLWYTDGMSYDQMASYLDVPMSTVKSRLHRAKLSLKEALQALASSMG